MKARTSLGTITYNLSGSTSTKGARLDIVANQSPAWLQSKDHFLTAGWLLLVECEATFIPSDLLPLTLGTLIGKMAVYFEYGTAGKPMPLDRSFRKLGAVELPLSIGPNNGVPTVMGWPNHRDFSAQLHPGALVAMVVTDSVEAMSTILNETARQQAVHAMAFGLEKWARPTSPLDAAPRANLLMSYRQG